MYRDRNRTIIREINNLDHLTRGDIVAENDSRTTKVFSLRSFYSRTTESEIYLVLKKYATINQPDLSLMLACELGLIDKVEKEYGSLVDEFPLIHALFIDKKGKPSGIITQDFSQGGAIPLMPMNQKGNLPIEIQKLIQSPHSLEDLATTCFLVGGKRRIGDFGEFIKLLFPVQLSVLSNYHLENIAQYTIITRLQEQFPRLA